MTGMSKQTGESMGETDHIRQSVADILTTRIGARVMRRDYGSLIPELIDQPNNPATRLRVMSATVMAIKKWEPRIAVTKVDFGFDSTGKAVVDMVATRTTGQRTDPNGIPLSIKVS